MKERGNAQVEVEEGTCSMPHHEALAGWYKDVVCAGPGMAQCLLVPVLKTFLA